MKQRIPGFQEFLAARFSPAEVYGLPLMAGLVLALVAASIFGVIVFNVVQEAPLTVLDMRLAQRFHTYADSGWTVIMLAITHAHATVPLLMFAGLLAAYFYGQRAYYWALTAALAVPSGMLLNVVLKSTFQRMRPQFDEPLVVLSTYSFPSGHANGATLLYGVIAAYCLCRLKTRSARLAACMAAALMAVLVALSRVYLGAHYLSDVMAGMAEAVCWLTLCITTISAIRRRRLARNAAGELGGSPAWTRQR